MSDKTSDDFAFPSRRQFIKNGLASGIALGVVGMPMLSQAKDQPKKKIKALLVTGGGYHDYEAQKTLLTEGISELIDIDWTIWHHVKANDLKTALSAEGWAAPFDVIIYNMCHANESDAKYIESVVNVHKAGKAMVAIHCTMHSYHWKIGKGKKSKEDKEWNKLLGVVSTSHGPRGPVIKVKQVEEKHDSYNPSSPEWSTPMGELYTISKVYPSATVLARGKSGKSEQPVIWTNKYEGANVFATTIGHHNETVQNPEFLKTIANGIVWAVSESNKAVKG